MKKNMIVMGIVVIVVAVGAFFGGMQYQKSQSPFVRGMMRGIEGGPMNADGNRPFRMGRDGGSMGGGAVTGEIIAQDEKTITVKMDDGSSKIINISDKTSINKASEATITDLKVGEKVAAFGTTNSDGSVSALNVQLNPIMRTFQRDGMERLAPELQQQGSQDSN